MNAPYHVAIIMDGNGRWAAARGLPKVLGHRAGAEAVRGVVEACAELGVRALTLYAFSWENWDRPKTEIRELMELLSEFLLRERAALLEQGIRLRAIGRLEQLPEETQTVLRRVTADTAGMTRMTLTLALSYGGRQEILDAAARLARLVRSGALAPDDITEARFAEQLYTYGLPDPDLLIRTSGERRLSNFLLWQTSYTELYVTPKMWPDFSREDLVDAFADFERRDRRYGRSSDGSRPAGSLEGPEAGLHRSHGTPDRA
ncbi:MAG TPA: polyprenyl diphosphate synthase [bacterium]